MNSSNLFYSSLMVLMMCLDGASCKGAERNAVTDKDTSVLARNEHSHSFIIDNSSTFFQEKLISTGKNFSGDKKLVLLLDDPKLTQNPDGVYEVYITKEKTDVKMLSSLHSGFVNVLDFYVLTTSAPPKSLSVSMSKLTGGWAEKGQPLAEVYVTVLFRGNVLADGTESKKAGQMSVKGIRVVQED